MDDIGPLNAHYFQQKLEILNSGGAKTGASEFLDLLIEIWGVLPISAQTELLQLAVASFAAKGGDNA